MPDGAGSTRQGLIPPAVFATRHRQKNVWVFAGTTHLGCVRERNEDSYSIEESHRILVVADGLGGQPAGDMASWKVATSLPQILKKRLGTGEWGPTAVRNALLWTVSTLSHGLYEEAKESSSLDGMGSTVVAAVLLDDEAVICHLGDSRAYLWNRGDLLLLTRDHSLHRLLLESGAAPAVDPGYEDTRSYVTGYVGMPDEANPEVVRCRMRPGHRLLLCTDGLSGEIDQESLARVLGAPGTPEEICQMLVDEALKNGGHDNITVIVAERIGSDDSSFARGRRVAVP